jgi:hypothetical protein
MVEARGLGALHLMHNAKARVLRGNLLEEGWPSLQQQHVSCLQ